MIAESFGWRVLGTSVGAIELSKLSPSTKEKTRRTVTTELEIEESIIGTDDVLQASPGLSLREGETRRE